MRRHATKTIAAVCILLGLMACSQGVRYSPQELTQFPPEIQEHIRNQELAIGMSPQAVRYSWGAPGKIEIVERSGRPAEVWTYPMMRIVSPSFVFVDGQLTGIIIGGTQKKPEAPAQGTEKK